MSGKQKTLHAEGSFKSLCQQWWLKNMSYDSKISAITLKGDGSVCFWWSDAEESGKYHLPFERLYK